MLKPTLVLHHHARFESCLLTYDSVCTVSAFSFVKGCNTKSAKARVLWYLAIILPALRKLFSVRVWNVALSGACRYRPKFSVCLLILGVFDFHATVEWIHVS